MGHPRLLLPFLLPAAVVGCAPVKVQWVPRRPVAIEVMVPRDQEALQAEVAAALRESMADAGPSAEADTAPVNKVVVDILALRPNPKSGFWKTVGRDTLVGAGGGAQSFSGLGLVVGTVGGLVAAPIDYATQRGKALRLGYLPFEVSGSLRAGAASEREQSVPVVADLSRLKLEPHLRPLPPEEAKDAEKVRAETLRALALAVRDALRVRGVV